MSLVYCNYGNRNYADKPISINTRGCWEFQFTVSGKNILKKRGDELQTWNENHNFWISTPDSTHGWNSADRKGSVIAVFHFSEIPESFSKIFNGRRTISARVDRKVLDSVLLMAKKLSPLVLSPHYADILEFEICCRKLCLLFLKYTDEKLESRIWNNHHQVVSAAVAWFCAHMNEGIGVHETAEKMGYSVSQLRKIFVKIRGVGPSEVFEECRMNRAKELLQHGQMSVIDISLECGYSNHSSFSRAFSKYYNETPIHLKKTHVYEF